MQNYWLARSSKQRLILVGAFLATFIGIFLIAGIAGRTKLALLYSGLEGPRASGVIRSVERAGVAYDIRGDAIYVDAAQRDQLRLTLASQNLPSSGGAGYELLDGMSGFGTTSQMFDAAYWRAKEGELARTIAAMPNVRAARVHLAAAARRGFGQKPLQSASVTLTTNGTLVSQSQAEALRFLIASAAAGMSPEDVTVIDGENGVVSTSKDASANSRANELKRNVERILESHVGVGNAIVELNLELVTETEFLTERRVDPDNRAMISQEVLETSDQTEGQSSAPVTAASNLPEDGTGDTDGGSSSRAESSQRVNYEISEVTREVSREPGSIQRMTVAVLVNGARRVAEDGTVTITPRNEAELDVMRDLVASVVGLSETRGDELTVRSLTFADLTQEGTVAEQAGLLTSLDVDTLARIGLVGLFTILLGAMMLRTIAKARNTPASIPELSEPGAPLLPALSETSANLPEIDSMGEIDILTPGGDGDGFSMMAMGDGDFGFSGASTGSNADDPVARMKTLMGERREETVKLLAQWLDDKEPAQ